VQRIRLHVFLACCSPAAVHGPSCRLPCCRASSTADCQVSRAASSVAGALSEVVPEAVKLLLNRIILRGHNQSRGGRLIYVSSLVLLKSFMAGYLPKAHNPTIRMLSGQPQLQVTIGNRNGTSQNVLASWYGSAGESPALFPPLQLELLLLGCPAGQVRRLAGKLQDKSATVQVRSGLLGPAPATKAMPPGQTSASRSRGQGSRVVWNDECNDFLQALNSTNSSSRSEPDGELHR